ncbi:hypothetical protein QVD17_23078 [Tagetes erecta]|uniref:VQ domain-containing protein n=1 Tax=Tagetes erecta TaxID=13708 RepID=A0AAD8KK31_TARER|nr:hypothetical protein QVD17_23078 [Tagetes erecta]
MSPAPFHAKQEQYVDDGSAYNPTPLKINKDSKFIHCLPPPSDAGLKNRSHEQQPPPRPLIIYTHSPKVIHTKPRDFMALVQKLTGYTPQPHDTQVSQCQAHNVTDQDNESTSVVTEEHGSSVNDISPVKSCFVDAMAPPPYPGFDPYFNTRGVNDSSRLASYSRSTR